MTSKGNFFEQVKGKLIVSCQALKNEPLFGADMMGKMAKAAEMGGAAAIRANGTEDIRAIKKSVHLPVIGLIKQDYPDSDVYITPTRKEMDELIAAGADIIALDATSRKRPNGESLQELVNYLKDKNQLIMADISTYEEGIHAAGLGFDCVSTTLSGYTSYSRQEDGPDLELVERLAKTVAVPVVAEGRITSPSQAAKALQSGAFTVVVGSAITRPQIITKMYIEAISKDVKQNESTEYAVKEQA
ncbi:N-acetylmannosamine-6-phosphate 2-epimerase [Bacillus sp. T33-2]|uniref:N-acetylmannosamine-6-phosphate 2-epimerase n=1 Tax=Bacillus sp. T33-2 TaxID=2054168 RepID=UPI000C783B14|nr:N-acetylmannosamine-6-phosphate 2-epimerase [Bacillus sp. T33-2]PLR95949.1 N-acetylmannosamine-6-phosphate 2-epimerase [Bacillus sp. T33-2]